jgi:hypothetical protein
MKNIKKVAAGIIAGAAITAAPLVAFAAPAFAATDASTAGAATSHQQHVLVNGASSRQSDTSRVLVNYTSPGGLRDGNAARCGGGINC